MSGTFKTIGQIMRQTFLTRYNHPRDGQNLLMSCVDRLDVGTDTTVVSQRSESGQGIPGTKTGRVMWLLYVVEVVVLSSHMMSVLSLTGHRDNVSCLTITTDYRYECYDSGCKQSGFTSSLSLKPVPRKSQDGNPKMEIPRCHHNPVLPPSRVRTF